jgi:hypothetical protein
MIWRSDSQMRSMILFENVGMFSDDLPQRAKHFEDGLMKFAFAGIALNDLPINLF